MRSAVRAMVVVCGIVLGLAPPALADGPGVGTPIAVTLGDSAISGEAGRWAGNTNNSSTRVDALGSTAYWDTASGESIPGCHRSKAAQAHIFDVPVPGANLACSGARTYTTGTGSGETFKPGHRLLLGRVRAQGTGAGAAAVREHAQRPRGRRDDRRQQLRLRRDRRALRDELADLAVVVEELLQRRLGHDVALHRHAPAAGDDQRQGRAAAGPDGDGERGLRSPRSTRSSPRPTGRRSRAATASATARPAGRASRSAAAASGTATPTGRTTSS